MFSVKTQSKIFAVLGLALAAVVAFPSLKKTNLLPIGTVAGDPYLIAVERTITQAEKETGKAIFKSKRGTDVEFDFPTAYVWTVGQGNGVLELTTGASFYNQTRLTGMTSIQYLLDRSDPSDSAQLVYGNDLNYLTEGTISLVTNSLTTINFKNPVDYFSITNISGGIFIKKLIIYFDCANTYQYLDDRETSSNDLFFTSALEQSFSWAYVYDRKCFGVANSSSGYSFHLTVNSGATGFPTWNYNFGSAVGATSYDIEFYAKGIGHTDYNLMLLDASNNNILSYNRSFEVSESWEKITISNLNVASGKSLADVQKIKLSANYGSSAGTERHLYLDQLKLINLLERPSRYNLEVVEYTRPSTTQTAVATYDYEETYGNSSTVSRKLDYSTATGFGNTETGTFRAFATFNVEASLGANNGIDSKNCTLSIDLKFPSTIVNSPDTNKGAMTVEITDGNGTTSSYFQVNFTMKEGWIHASRNLTGLAQLSSLNGHTKKIRLGFYGVYTGNKANAQINIDNFAMTSNS